MIESMLVGTPVIALRQGSVAEVVDDGVTGFIVENADEAVAALSEAARMDRRAIRSRFEERFSARRMARAYEGRYRKLIAAGSFNAGAFCASDKVKGLRSCPSGQEI
jgi:glycosyltransferase involved in cell wall biosynthesis